MMLHKINSTLCRLCGKDKQQGTDVFKDKVKGAVLVSIINKYFSKEVINISSTDTFSKYVCIDCEQRICIFDEFCLMVANVQKQLAAPSLEIDFTEICRMSFNQREILTKHKESHEGRKQFQCANCHQSFRYKVSLRSHLINFHTDMDQATLNSGTLLNQNPLLTCSECGKLFATKYKLQRHARCHTGERPFRCTYCDRTFSQTGNLKIHQVKCHQMTCSISDNCSIPETREHSQQMNREEERNIPGSLNNFQSIFFTESEIQKTINDTINSTDPNASYLNKSYENPIYIDEEIETMLDQDLGQLDRNKYSTVAQEKVSLCLKQPETPELLHSLFYDN
ncbi:oocyte zinc finger protein XlCOF28 isoform X3 [Orussus abietinus]|uniref:oocyte zinc finger protein XlCOF28 isoform X3 n=1 Tax=Orussus abietinus TaxID=222816 RepID=UPI000624FD63|nr:oocyte zinc finger protein XlCOF28 isoform X3 [Orussus abietinus]